MWLKSGRIVLVRLGVNVSGICGECDEMGVLIKVKLVARWTMRMRVKSGMRQALARSASRVGMPIVA
jgi:hypothetical protein